jgi:hypothetical protein
VQAAVRREDVQSLDYKCYCQGEVSSLSYFIVHLRDEHHLTHSVSGCEEEITSPEHTFQFLKKKIVYEAFGVFFSVDKASCAERLKIQMYS